MSHTRGVLYELLVHGSLRSVAAPTYDLVVAIELGVQKALDVSLRKSYSQQSPLLAELTAVIKTFERRRSVARLLKSIRRLYPSLGIVVVDDSRHPKVTNGVETVVMPFNTGVSAGRREGLRRVRTKYTLILDDDYVLYRHSRIIEALLLMERHSQIDIMGGAVIQLPFYRVTDGQSYARVAAHSGVPMQPQSCIGLLKVLDMVPNFYIARTERLRLVDWDPALKRVEHSDFFNRSKGILTTVCNPRLRCLHVQTPFDREYMARRTDTLLDSAILRYRWRKLVGTGTDRRAADCEPDDE